jgi:hypothetical protein
VLVAIDITCDFSADTPAGMDPDSCSPTLRRYHQLLWSKPLPSGKVFELTDTSPRAYLEHCSVLGEFSLSSDGLGQAFKTWKRLKPITEQVSASENEEFDVIASTIGARIVFPGNKIKDAQTINGARGFHPLICDRFDLTLECIRRHYSRLESPLSTTLGRYGDFFALFGDFRGYVSFFLLDDLVTDDLRVKLLTDFDDDGTFPSPALPQDVETYKEYLRGSIEFFEARNGRIEQLHI